MLVGSHVESSPLIATENSVDAGTLQAASVAIPFVQVTVQVGITESSSIELANIPFEGFTYGKRLSDDDKKRDH